MVSASSRGTITGGGGVVVRVGGGVVRAGGGAPASGFRSTRIVGRLRATRAKGDSSQCHYQEPLHRHLARHGFSSVPDCNGVVDALSICAFVRYSPRMGQRHRIALDREARVRAAGRLRRARAGQIDGRLRGALRPRRRRSRGLLGRGGAPPRLDPAVYADPRRVEGALRALVRRRQAQPQPPTASTATSATRGDKPALVWIGEPGDRRTLTLSRAARRGLPHRQRAHRARRQGRRSRRHLPADGARAGDRAARLRAHRRHALGHLRRLLRRRDPRSRQRRRLQDDHHRRRRLAARQGRAAQGHRRRRARTQRLPHRREGARASRARRSPVAMVEQRDVALGAGRRRRRRPEHAPVALDAEHPLFILYTSGTTGKPKGVVHSTGGYARAGAATPRASSSICATTTSTGAPPTSAGSPATATSSTARS